MSHFECSITCEFEAESVDWELSMEAVEDGLLIFTGAIETEHIHKFGPVEIARFTGNPHRQCQDPDCQHVTLDLGECNECGEDMVVFGCTPGKCAVPETDFYNHL